MLPTPYLRRELDERSLPVARAFIVAFAVLFTFAYAHWLARWIEIRQAAANALPLSVSSDALHLATTISIVIAIAAVLAWWIVAGLIFVRRSRDLLGLYFAMAFFFFGPCLTDPNLFTIVARQDDIAILPAVMLLANSLTMPWLLVFPDGKLIPRWGAIVVVIWIGWYVVRVFVPAADPDGLWLLPWAAMPIFAVGTLVFRGLRRSDAVQRQQLKWLILVGIVYLLMWFAVGTIPSVFQELQTGESGFLYRTAAASFYALTQIALPIALAIAIFRQGLFDIDLLINRTLAYATLTVILVAGFVLLSSAANRVLEVTTGARSDLASAVVAIVVALAFLPLRALLLAVADRFMSGRRVLTILFVDIVGSTPLALSLGDRAWRERLERFRVIVRTLLRRYGGEEIDTAGDGFFITFGGPGAAIRCARAITEAVRVIGIEVRAGLHVGEVEVFGPTVSGAAVHVGARVLGLAAPSEVLISGALRDLIAGSNIELVDRGSHELKGVPGSERIFSVSAV